MKQNYYLTLCLLLLTTIVFGQNKFNDLLLKIDKDLEMLGEKYPREAISLLTDKQEYYLGDNIFLSAFLTINGKQSPLSKTIYIELGDYSGKILEKKMLSAEAGIASAMINISPDWPSGPYVMNAYSLWMKNTPELIAQKQVVIIGQDYVTKPFLLHQKNAPISIVRFEPEGHSWVANSAQNFVVQIVDKNGLPLKKSFIITENSKEITTSETDENGISKFQLTPKTGTVYQLKSGDQLFGLKLPSNEGLALSFNNDNKTKLFVSLQKSASNRGNQFLLVGMDDEKVCYQSVFDFAEGTTATAITKVKLPAGLLRFLLFDENGQIIAERSFYNYLPVPSFSKDNAGNKLALNVDSVSPGVLVLSVPFSPVVINSPYNLLSLFPEIQNQYCVQIPDFSTNSLQTLDALFYLQPAKQVGKAWSITEPQLRYAVESGITLRGNIKPFAGSRNPSGYKAEIVIKGEDSTTAFTSVQTAANGDFVIGDVGFQNAAKIFFQGNNTEKSKELLNMQLYPSYFDTLAHLTVMPHFKYEKHYINTAVSPDVKKYFEDLAVDPRFKSLETIVIRTKAKSPFDSLKQAYLTPMFADGNSTLLQPEGHFINFWHFLRGRIPGLKVEGSLDNPSVSFTRYGGTLINNNSSGEDLSESFGETAGVLYFLNEVPVSKDVVSTINPNDVALVSVNKEPMPVLGAYNGMIAIFTKKGTNLGGSTSKSMAFERRLGYTNFAKTYRLEESQYKKGATVLFATIKKPVQITLPGNSSYKAFLIGWNKQKDLVITVN